MLSRIFGKKSVSENPKAKPAATADVEKKAEITKKEEKPVAEKITVGHVHMSGCTGCLVSLSRQLRWIAHNP